MKQISALAVLLFASNVFANPETENFLKDIDALTKAHTQLKALHGYDEYYSRRKFFKDLMFSPEISISSGKQNVSTSTDLSKSDATSDYWALNAKLNLFEGGGSFFAKRAANLNSEAHSLELLTTQQSVEKSASDILFTLISISEQNAILNRLLAIKQESLRVVKERFLKGQIPSQEVKKAEVDLSQTESQLRDKKIQAIEAETSFRNILDAAPLTKNWPFDASSKLWNDLNVNLNLDLKLAEKRMLAKESSYKQTESTFWPSIDLSYSYQEPLSGSSYKQTTTGISISLPIFTRGDRLIAKSQAFGEFKEITEAYNQTKKEISNRLQTAKEKFELQRKNLNDASENLEKSKQLYGDILKNFRLGRVTVNELFQEQARLLDVELTYLSQQKSFHTRFVETCLMSSEKIASCIK